LLLGFIKGPLVDDWVKRWTQWAINQFSINHRPPTDEYYWTEISNGFQTAFQDTGARERAEKELHMLRWDPESVDTFLARFESLAEAADFELDSNPTKSILARKLPFNMVDHLYKVVKPGTYPEYCEAIRQFHADNTAVQNLKGHQDKGAPYTKGQDGLYTKKDRKNLLGGYTANEWAKILGVDQSKIEIPRRSDAMDTSARFRSKFQRTKGRTGPPNQTLTPSAKKAVASTATGKATYHEIVRIKVTPAPRRRRPLARVALRKQRQALRVQPAVMLICQAAKKRSRTKPWTAS
jgi:hypothetical protein